MTTEGVPPAASIADALKPTDVGIYGLLDGFRSLRIDAKRGLLRAFGEMDDDRLVATGNRASNTIEGALSALRAVGVLLREHDPDTATVDAVDVGDAVRMLTDLLDGARLIEADAAIELQRRHEETDSAQRTEG